METQSNSDSEPDLDRRRTDTLSRVVGQPLPHPHRAFQKLTGESNQFHIFDPRCRSAGAAKLRAPRRASAVEGVGSSVYVPLKKKTATEMPRRNKRSQALKRRHAKLKANLLKRRKENPPIRISVLQVNVVRLPDKLVKKLLEESLEQLCDQRDEMDWRLARGC
ncbi:unnamed protein product [Boreogadus saida]